MASQTSLTPVTVTIKNETDRTPCNFVANAYEHGQLREGSCWPKVLEPSKTCCTDSEGTPPNAGCSGYVTYEMGNERKVFSIAFSNMGAKFENMVACSDCSGKEAEQMMKSYNYERVKKTWTIDGVPHDFVFQCSRGPINSITVSITREM